VDLGFQRPIFATNAEENPRGLHHIACLSICPFCGKFGSNLEAVWAAFTAKLRLVFEKVFTGVNHRDRTHWS
jgi:hypothetical protein